MQNDIFSIIVLNRQIITDWTQMTHMFSGQIKYGPTEVLVASGTCTWMNLN